MQITCSRISCATFRQFVQTSMRQVPWVWGIIYKHNIEEVLLKCYALHRDNDLGSSIFA